MTHTRRSFLATMSVAGAAAAFLRARQSDAAESPLETATVRLLKTPGICLAPQYLSEALLRAEGFTHVEYVDEPDYNAALPRGQVDFTMNYATNFVRSIDAGAPIILLAGIHVGCYELFTQAGIRSMADLKGKSVGIQALGSNPHVLLTLLAAQVGLDPSKDIHWVTDPSVKPFERFVDGKIDAFLGSAGAAGSARPAYRPRYRQYRRRSSLVAVFLLPAGWQCGIRADAPGRHQAGAARGSQGG